MLYRSNREHDMVVQNAAYNCVLLCPCSNCVPRCLSNLSRYTRHSCRSLPAIMTKKINEVEPIAVVQEGGQLISGYNGQEFEFYGLFVAMLLPTYRNIIH